MMDELFGTMFSCDLALQQAAPLIPDAAKLSGLAMRVHHATTQRVMSKKPRRSWTAGPESPAHVPGQRNRWAAKRSAVRAILAEMKALVFAEVDHSKEDTARFAAMTPAARLALFFELCDLTDAIQAGRPNRSSLRAQQPCSLEAITLWKKLMNGRGP